MITKPLFSEPFLVVTFDYMSRDFLEQLGLIGLSYVEGAISYVAPTPSLTPDIDLTATDISKPTRKKNPKKKKQELVIPEITFEDSYAPAAL